MPPPQTAGVVRASDDWHVDIGDGKELFDHLPNRYVSSAAHIVSFTRLPPFQEEIHRLNDVADIDEIATRVRISHIETVGQTGRTAFQLADERHGHQVFRLARTEQIEQAGANDGKAIPICERGGKLILAGLAQCIVAHGPERLPLADGKLIITHQPVNGRGTGLHDSRIRAQSGVGQRSVQMVCANNIHGQIVGQRRVAEQTGQVNHMRGATLSDQLLSCLQIA